VKNYMIIKQRVRDLDQFQRAFDKLKPMRERHGMSGGVISDMLGCIKSVGVTPEATFCGVAGIVRYVPKADLVMRASEVR